MDLNLKDELRFINKSIEWNEKNTHLFYYSDSNIDIISELDKLFTSNFNKNKYQMRTKVIKSYDKEVNSYNLFYEMSEKYKNENSPIKEHK